jgi:hypothetical protein
MKTRFSRREAAQLSPQTKKLQRQVERNVKHRAVKDVLDATQDGKPSYGSIKATVEKYNKIGCNYVTVGVIKHHLYKIKQGKRSLESFGGSETTCTTDLINNDFPSTIVIPQNSTSPSLFNLSPPSTSTDRRNGGRPLGSNVQLKEALIAAKAKATTEAATRYSQARMAAKAEEKVCKCGQLLSIIREAEEENGLLKNTVSIETVKSRVKRNNLNGSTYQKTSPMEDVETVLVQYCKRLAMIGDPLKKDDVISLANEIIAGTPHEARIVAWMVIRFSASLF